MNEVSVWSFGKMILVEENENNCKETCPSASLSTANHMCYVLVLHSSQCSRKTATNCLSCEIVHLFDYVMYVECDQCIDITDRTLLGLR
jgi:hypothetical protein